MLKSTKFRSTMAVAWALPFTVHAMADAPGTTEQGSSISAAGTQSRARAESTEQLQEVVVTAQKREERLQDVPISISVLAGEALDNSSFQGSIDALRTVPGVAAFPIAGMGSSLVIVRGVAPNSEVFGGSSPSAYYIDSSPFGLVDSALVPDVNAYDLQRVEVLRGPQGTLYGASSLNGVVRVLTNDADLNNFDFKARGLDSYTDGGGNNYQGDMAVNVPIVDGKLAARAVIGYQDLSGWIDTPTGKGVNDAILRNMRLKIDGQPTDELSIGLSGWLSRQDYGATSVANDQNRTDHALPGPISTDWGNYALKVGYALPAFYITSVTSYLNYASHDATDSIDALGHSYPSYEHWNAHVATEELNLNSTQQGPWRWTAGALYRSGQNATAQISPGIYTVDWIDTSRSYAIFGELSRRFLENFEWTLGARYFHDEVSVDEGHDVVPLNVDGIYYRAAASFNATTPRAVLTWHPDQSSTIYGSFSEGFRSGAPQNPYDVGGMEGVAPVQPDKLYNYEIGAKTDLFEKRVSVNAAIYYMDWRNVQQLNYLPFQDTFVAAIVNGPAASGPGIDLGLTLRPYQGLELNLTGSYNDLTMDRELVSQGEVLFSKGERLNFSAKYTLGGSATYSFPLGNGYTGHAAVSDNYTSALSNRAIVGTAESTFWGNPIQSLHAEFELLAPTHWSFTLFGDNLTNSNPLVYNNPFQTAPYCVTGPAYCQGQGVRIRPRTAGLQVEYHLR